MLQREGYSDTFVTDVPFSRVSAFKQAIAQRHPEELYGAGDEAGMLALFGIPSRFQGREVTGYSMGSGGRMPFDFLSTADPQGGVDWDRTEKINRVPLQEVDPRNLKSTQPFVTHGGMFHYLHSQEGELYADKDQESNRHPAVFEDMETGERRILTGHHRATAALIQGKPLMARLVRGRLREKPQG